MNSPSKANWHSSRKRHMDARREEVSFLLFFYYKLYGCRHRNVSGHLSYNIDSLLVAEWGQHANRAKTYKLSNFQEKVRDYTLRISLETGSNCPLNQSYSRLCEPITVLFPPWTSLSCVSSLEIKRILIHLANCQRFKLKTNFTDDKVQENGILIYC